MFMENVYTIVVFTPYSVKKPKEDLMEQPKHDILTIKNTRKASSKPSIEIASPSLRVPIILLCALSPDPKLNAHKTKVFISNGIGAIMHVCVCLFFVLVPPLHAVFVFCVF